MEELITLSKPANELILVLDFGGQYNQLIARRVREDHVYCEVHPNTLSLEKIKEMAPKGIILTGGPNSVYKAVDVRLTRPGMIRGRDAEITEPDTLSYLPLRLCFRHAQNLAALWQFILPKRCHINRSADGCMQAFCLIAQSRAL